MRNGNGKKIWNSCRWNEWWNGNTNERIGEGKEAFEESGVNKMERLAKTSHSWMNAWIRAIDFKMKPYWLRSIYRSLFRPFECEPFMTFQFDATMHRSWHGSVRRCIFQNRASPKWQNGKHDWMHSGERQIHHWHRPVRAILYSDSLNWFPCIFA